MFKLLQCDDGGGVGGGSGVKLSNELNGTAADSSDMKKRDWDTAVGLDWIVLTRFATFSPSFVSNDLLL